MRVDLRVCADICVYVFKWSLAHNNVRSLISVSPLCLYNFIYYLLF